MNDILNLEKSESSRNLSENTLTADVYRDKLVFPVNRDGLVFI